MVRRRRAFKSSIPLEYEYIAEGGKNIVARYNGQDPFLKGLVVRIPKRVKYKNQVILPDEVIFSYFPRNYLLPCQLVPVSPKFITGIEKEFHSTRPIKRTLEPLCREVKSAYLIQDLTAKYITDSQEICIEIKPKCGFVPDSYLLSRETRHLKAKISRFQLYQVLKFKDKKWEKISKYDPLDLFSGERSRVTKALESLVESPQNNLRVFFNGSIVSSESLNKERITSLANLLVKSKILSCIKESQKLDRLNIENVFKVYTGLLSGGAMKLKKRLFFYFPLAVRKKPLSFLSTVILELNRKGIFFKKLNKEYQRYRLCSEKELMGQIRKEELDPLFGVFIIRDFLISATFKDCSIMICTQNSNSFDGARISLVDFDRKALSKIPYYQSLDGKIIKTYKECMNT